MITINGNDLKRTEISRYIIKNIVYEVIDIENTIEEYYKIGYLINDKITFLNFLGKNFNIKKRFLSYIRVNDFNIEFNSDRFSKYSDHLDKNKMDRYSDTFMLLKYGTLDNELKKLSGVGKDKFILRHGKEIGEQKYKNYCEIQKKSSKRTLEYWINQDHTIEEASILLKEYQSSHIIKHMSDKDENYIEEYNNRNTTWRPEFYIHRGFSVEQANQLISEMKKKSSMFCKEYYINKGYSLEESMEISKDYWYKHCYNTGNNISKESIKLFKPIIDELSKIENICIYYGDKENNKNEYFLYDKENKKYYFYDLTILYNDIKLIVEYNGVKFHPNKEKLTSEEWTNWRCLFTEQTADDKYKMDLSKKELAIQNEFKYLEVWSSETIEENTTKIISFLEIIKNKYQNE